MSARRIGAQHELSRVLATASSVEEAAPRILAIVARSLSSAVAELWIEDEGGRGLRCAGFWSAEAPPAGFEAAARTGTFALGEGLPGRVWRSGRAAVVRDVTEDDAFVRMTQAYGAGLRGALALPIEFAGRAVGVLQLFFREAGEVPTEVVDLFADVGAQLGLFLERSRVSEAVVRQAKQIVELSVPVLRVAPRVLAIPILGALDHARAEHLASRALEAIERTGSHTLVLDLTAAVVEGPDDARRLLEIVDAVRLLGARAMVTGISPSLAATLALTTTELARVEAYGTLAEGVRAALEVTR